MESFRRADVLYFGWWDSYHLMEWVKKTQLDTELKELLESKVYVWMSAWSMITNENLDLKLSSHLYNEKTIKTEKMDGLNYVNLYYIYLQKI